MLLENLSYRAKLALVCWPRLRRALAVSAAVEPPFHFQAVPDDAAAAVAADRGQAVNRAFKAVEDVSPAADRHFEGQMIVVPAQRALALQSGQAAV